MAGSIEDVAKSWLMDPAWQKVFKHTIDVIEDYVSYVLITVGAVSLSVKLLTTLSSGDVVCMIVGVRNNHTLEKNLGPYPSGGTAGMLNYAQTDPLCIREVLSEFMEYLPYILLLETLFLVMIEKGSFKIPRIAQKVERFYKNIVEESLFGKDPDVIEDMTDPKTSTEAISRQRQRNEICISLKRGSMIHHVYIAKNALEVFIVCLFLPMNMSYAIFAQQGSGEKQCEVPISAIDGTSLDEGTAIFQCRGKKLSFFILVLYIQSILLACHGVLSIGAIIWCWKFRAVTNLLKNIEGLRSIWEPGQDTCSQGRDFLFLFDLLAHNCGLEATLRVLTHSDDNFYEICKPTLHTKVLEEDKLKISWIPADIERWMRDEGRKKYRSSNPIDLESYEVTIFPAETMHNTINILAKKDDDETDNYYTWFYDLVGGKTEYVITIACIIGKSRMKGEKVVTNLVPYGAERPRNGILEKAGTTEVELFWDAPKGEFTKYTIIVDKVVPMPKTMMTSEVNILRLTSLVSGGGEPSYADLTELDRSNLRHIEISSKLTRYTVKGLDPGERYSVELGTKTGNVETRNKIKENVMTRPTAVGGLMVTDITFEACTLLWVTPVGHPCLRGFDIVVTSGEGKVFKQVTIITKAKQSWPFGDMVPATDYDITVAASCAWSNQVEESEKTKVSLTTIPEAIRNLRMESATHNSIIVKWDASSIPAQHLQQSKLRMTIVGIGVEYSHSVDIPADKTQYNISKLPDPEGSGRKYAVSIVCSVLTQRNNEVQSKSVESVCATIPLKPSGLKVSGDGSKMEITWTKSPTPHVVKYKVRWRSAEEASKVEEATVSAKEIDDFEDEGQFQNSENLTFVFPSSLSFDVVYKVNVYAVVMLDDDSALESKEAHEKFIIKKDGGPLEVFVEEPKN
jgi:hypothetical protein